MTLDFDTFKKILQVIFSLPCIGALWGDEKIGTADEKKGIFAIVGNLIVLWVFIIACIIGLW